LHERKPIYPPGAAKPLAPYSPGIDAACFVFVSGQLGLDPAVNKLVPGGIEAETRQALTNVQTVLAAAELTLDKVVKVTVFLRDINDFAAMNSVYGQFFVNEPPARSAFQVAALPLGAAVEIEAIALKS